VPDKFASFKQEFFNIALFNLAPSSQALTRIVPSMLASIRIAFFNQTASRLVS